MSESEFPTMLSPGRIGTLRIRNRIVMAPIDSVIRDTDGGTNAEHRAFLAARAAGGVGLILSDNLIVRWPEGSVGSKSLRIDQDRFIPSLGELVEEVHQWDCPIVAQINHAGRQTTLGGSQGQELVSPSAISWPDSGTVPRALTKTEISEIRQDFLAAAVRASRAGFDGVEIHAANGYLLSSFLSPALNHRTDDYGGSVRNRARLLLEIAEDVRDVLGDFPLLVRMNCRDGLTGGLEPEEAAATAAVIAGGGVDAIDVSAGTYEASALTFPPMMLGEGHIMNAIEKIKSAVDVPVIGVGRIVRPPTAERYLREGYADFLALGRALIADPQWVHKSRFEDLRRIRHCIGCNHGCIRRIDMDLTMRCNVNPDVGRERVRIPLKPSDSPKKILVAGAGPAGIEFALRATRKGHDAKIYERDCQIGGQLVSAQVPEFKRDLGTLRSHYAAELERANVEVVLRTEVTADLVDAEKPDLMVVATGAIPANPSSVPCPDGSLTYKNVLEGRLPPEGHRVVVLGGGPNGCETAIYLAELGYPVSIVEATSQLVQHEDPSIGSWVHERCHSLSISVFTGSPVSSAEDGKLLVSTGDTGPSPISYDTLVTATGMIADRSLTGELDSRDVTMIGDAYRVGTILEATERAAWLADQL